MCAKQVTKRCHWVPQVYLRGFSTDSSKRKIWRLSKNSGAPELKSIEKVAVQFHLYAPLNKNGQRDDSFEKKLAELETWFSSPIWKNLQTNSVDLSNDTTRKMISLLAATMYLRNPNHYELTKRVHSQLLEFFDHPSGQPSKVEINGKSYLLDPHSWPEFRDASEDDIKKAWISDINNATSLAKILMSMRWSMLCSESPAFITTDNPVICVHPSLKFRGFSNPDSSVLFPISPTRLLCLDHLHKEPANQYYALNGNGAAQNTILWRYSREHLFSNRNPDLICEEILKDADKFNNRPIK